jgi:uncharacterized NAD(P)/FAD-binding protein YdhS
MTTVAVVGGGAAGVLTTAHLARRWPADSPLRVVLYDAGSRPGRGVAYSTTDPRHLLNVPAANMSALADAPADFVQWLRERESDASADDFRSRSEYGDYLAETLADCAAAVGLAVRRTTVTDIARSGARYRIVHESGVDEVDACVLALGYAPPVDPETVVTPEAPCYVNDPWASGALPALVDCTSRGDQVLLIGTGLTAIDVALSLTAQGRRAVAVSRHGWLPRPHRLPLMEPVPLADDAVAPLTADELVALVDRHIRASPPSAGGWRAAVDGLRPVTAKLWGRLPVEEKRALLAGKAREWEILRHRIAPAVVAEVEQLLAAKALVVRNAEVLAAVGEERAWQVTLRRDGTVTKLFVAAVVNCTGPSCDVRRYPGGVGERLLGAGLVVADELGLGVRTTSDGGVLDADGGTDGRLWTLGALRRGALYESTAIPELRTQAAVVAEQLATRFAVSSPARDRRGRSSADSSSLLRASGGRG